MMTPHFSWEITDYMENGADEEAAAPVFRVKNVFSVVIS